MTEPPVSPEDAPMQTQDPVAPTPAPPPAAPATRTAPSDDAPPPAVSPARGPLGQITPDVATGATPLTRHDD